ncbi:helix-turn-helix transcriptional regulator [Amycolatopsis aidingensis]|uniref:helix-turn-helix transcriptional regulator n=1 Tax=Amycolatopsis aidingensis TaxID=2842453 RepID=UPI001C0AD97B|nr:helix-turn-helix transcriptional regulator [Amycolatopsis aidingensis]
MRIDGEAYQRALGEELRKLRKRRGWTRKELKERLQSEISLQTLATYELGTRQCSVVRLIELCVAMDEPPQDLIGRVHRRMFTDEPGRVRVHLPTLVANAAPELLPMRRWAEDRLRQSVGTVAEVQLDRAAISWMAELCGLEPGDLAARLHNLAEYS